jgi:ABC-type transport system substrate-binding protein
MKRWFPVILTILIGITLILVGCGEKTTTITTTKTATVTQTQTPGGGSTTTTTPPTSETPDIKKGGVINVIINAGPAMMSYKGQMGPSDATYTMPAIEYLIEPYVDEEGNRGWIPFLAESYNIDPVAKTFTFKLRQGVKFHDG